MFQGPRTQLDWTLDPLDALSRWPADRPVMMLHSGRTHARWSRWSVLATPGHGAEDRWVAQGPPRAALREFEDKVAGDDALWVGYLGYDLGRRIENVGSPDTKNVWPDGWMRRCPGWLLHDRVEGRWHACGTWAGNTYDSEGSALPDELRDLPNVEPATATFQTGELEAQIDRDAYLDKVRRCKDYIAAGDVFQVNFTQQFGTAFAGSSRGLFAALAVVSPAWYGAYLECPDIGSDPSRTGVAAECWPALASISPELFFELRDDGTVTTRPIKGTAPADASPEVLENSTKDTAELAMIVDLLRNDLGRVCAYGTVQVAEPRTIEHHPTVQHGVATVTGQLHPSRGLADLLRAVLPGGSITGAPKVRAMQIIDELEAAPRGPYCGAIGWVQGNPGTTRNSQNANTRTPAAHFRGRAAFNLAIRTVLVAEGRASFGVGGGIVADSTPAAEYDETLTKAAAIRHALSRGSPGARSACSAVSPDSARVSS